MLAMLPWALSWAPFAWSGLPAFHALGYRSKFDYVAAMVIEFLFFVLVCPASGHVRVLCALHLSSHRLQVHAASCLIIYIYI